MHDCISKLYMGYYFFAIKSLIASALFFLLSNLIKDLHKLWGLKIATMLEMHTSSDGWILTHSLLNGIFDFDLRLAMKILSEVIVLVSCNRSISCASGALSDSDPNIIRSKIYCTSTSWNSSSSTSEIKLNASSWILAKNFPRAWGSDKKSKMR